MSADNAHSPPTGTQKANDSTGAVESVLFKTLWTIWSLIVPGNLVIGYFLFGRLGAVEKLGDRCLILAGVLALVAVVLRFVLLNAKNLVRGASAPVRPEMYSSWEKRLNRPLLEEERRLLPLAVRFQAGSVAVWGVLGSSFVSSAAFYANGGSARALIGIVAVFMIHLVLRPSRAAYHRIVKALG